MGARPHLSLVLCAALLGSLLGGCGLLLESPTPAPVGELDAGPVARPDAGPVTRPDAGPVTRPDAGPVTRPDAGPPPEPDAGPPPLRSCDELYGEAPNYQLCFELPRLCHFFVDPEGDDPDDHCTNACTSLGGTCVYSYDNPAPDRCDPTPRPVEMGGDCDTPHNNQVCVCARRP